MKTLSPLNLGTINQKIPNFQTVSNLPPASRFGVGTAQINGEMYASNGQTWKDNQGRCFGTDTSNDIPPRYDVSLMTITQTVTRGASMPAAGDIVLTNYGTKLFWPIGTNPPADSYLQVSLTPATPYNISDIDHLMFEILSEGNYNNTKLHIIVKTGSDSSRWQWNGGKRSACQALSLIKSDFTTFSGAGVNWANVTQIDFRLLKSGTQNASQYASVELRRMTIGGKTRPMVLFSADDNAVELHSAYLRNKSLNIIPDMYVKDYDLQTEDNHSVQKCTLAQDIELANAGYKFYPHQIEHRAYAHLIQSYSRSGDTVSIVINPFGVGDPSKIMPSVGDYVIIDEACALQLNGRFAVTAVTLGDAATTNSTIQITVPGATFDNTAVTEGATLTVEKNDFLGDFKLLQAMIKQSGLPTSERYMSYTYGRSSSTVRKSLARNGVHLARGTLGVTAEPENSAEAVFQISRKWGLGGGSDRCMSIPTDILSTQAALQTRITRLLKTGGVISVYTHGDDISTANLDACYALLATLRDTDQLDIINMEELEAHIVSRRI